MSFYVVWRHAVAVKSPKLREVKKARKIMTEEEFTKFMACPGADLELRMLARASRCEGGISIGIGARSIA